MAFISRSPSCVNTVVWSVDRRVPLHVTSRSMRSQQRQHRGPVRVLDVDQFFRRSATTTNIFREQCPLRDVPADAGDCRENGLWKCPACSRTFRRSTDFSKHWPRCRVRPELAAAPPCQRDVNARTLPCQFCGSLWAYPSQRARHEVRCPQRPER